MPPTVTDICESETSPAVNLKTDSTPTNAASTAQLDASKLTYTLSTSLRDVPDEASANIGPDTIYTDHMVTVAWNASTGWAAPELKPYGPLNLMPTSSVFNYATECFEGMKAYRGDDGKLRLFRPDRNCARFNVSVERISPPNFEAAESKKPIIALLSIDGPLWLPKDRAGGFLYIRLVMIGTQPKIGVSAPGEALLYTITCFMPRLDSYPGGMPLHTSPDNIIRA